MDGWLVVCESMTMIKREYDTYTIMRMLQLIYCRLQFVVAFAGEFETALRNLYFLTCVSIFVKDCHVLKELF